MLLEGEGQFIGLIALYRNSRLTYAVAARDVGPGETMGPEDFEFIDKEECLNQLKQITPRTISRLDEPVQKLKSLIDTVNNDEVKYQKILEDYPWVLGVQYRMRYRPYVKSFIYF